ncbi:MAG: glycosyltransferase family 2 protein [Nanoarchaeota archaeon]|nr:glycosyltransferase family 2 protein [Nanoarchaeota archaeon]
MKKELSIIIPCYNEAENMPFLLDKFKEILNGNLLKTTELILVDNNSNDNTKEVLKKLLKRRKYPFARSVFQKIPGYGAAVYKGFSSAKGKYICHTHADLQTDPKDTIKAFEMIKSNDNPQKTFIKGKRYGRSFSDRFFTFGMSIFETLVLKKFLYDINAQPNIFHKDFLRLIKNPPEDFSFDLYAYYLAKSNGYIVIRFPVYFGKRLHGHSAWNFGFKSRFKLIKRTINFTFKLKKILEEN